MTSGGSQGATSKSVSGDWWLVVGDLSVTPQNFSHLVPSSKITLKKWCLSVRDFHIWQSCIETSNWYTNRGYFSIIGEIKAVFTLRALIKDLVTAKLLVATKFANTMHYIVWERPMRSWIPSHPKTSVVEYALCQSSHKKSAETEWVTILSNRVATLSASIRMKDRRILKDLMKQDWRILKEPMPGWKRTEKNRIEDCTTLFQRNNDIYWQGLRIKATSLSD